MKEKLLSADLMFWRANRPNEWIMDIFIKKATQLEAEIIQRKEIEDSLQKEIVRLDRENSTVR